jgi:polysaccharide pyruvyl transferase WcaK-like protein
MKHFLLYGHGGSYNHGGEAIVRTTIETIREKYDDAHITLSSHFSEQDREFFIDADEIITPDSAIWESEKKSSGYEKEEFARLMYEPALSKISSKTTLLSVGGDNFCYPNWHRLKIFQDEAAHRKARSILWSASVEPSAITPEMVSVLNSYNVITARERRTYNALHERGIKSEVIFIPDVAFRLKPEAVDMPSGFGQGGFIGINISPLVIRREKVSGILKENIAELINFILAETDFGIALIPHVVMPMDNDYAVLSEIYDGLSKNDRIWLVGDKYSAAQYKFIISRCKLLFCSRTHASIAAYSFNIPCAVVGYSIKSVGIAEDLGMGGYVLPVERITENSVVRDLFVFLLKNGAFDSKMLRENMVDYCKKIDMYKSII